MVDVEVFREWASEERSRSDLPLPQARDESASEQGVPELETASEEEAPMIGARASHAKKDWPTTRNSYRPAPSSGARIHFGENLRFWTERVLQLRIQAEEHLPSTGGPLALSLSAPSSSAGTRSN